MVERTTTLQRLLVTVVTFGISIVLSASLQLGGRDGSAFAGDPAVQHAKAARDWTKFPAILQLNTSDDIAAVGDVHGDYKRLARLLAAAKLIQEAAESPKNIQWTGGRTVLVCTGDLIDKGDHSLDVIACFRLLQQQSLAAGGRVVVTMGNHEAEFLADPEDDEKAEQFLQELEEADIEPSDISSGKDTGEIGDFLRSLPFAAKINNWFFAHACNTKGMTMTTLNRELQDSVNEDGFGADILVGKSGLLEARLKPIPWWERSHDTPDESAARLRSYADALEVKHFVMGHQPGKAHFSDGTKRQGGEMIEKFDGLIFLIDVGMSHAINKSKGALLKITRRACRDSASVVEADGSIRILWAE